MNKYIFLKLRQVTEKRRYLAFLESEPNKRILINNDVIINVLSSRKQIKKIIGK